MFAKKSFLGGIVAVALVLGTSGAALADAADPSVSTTQSEPAPAPAPEPAPAPAPEPEPAPAPAPEPAPAPAPEPAPAPAPAPEPAPAPAPEPATEPDTGAATTQQLQSPAPAQRSAGGTVTSPVGDKSKDADKGKDEKDDDKGKDDDKDKDGKDDCDDDSKRDGKGGKDDDCRDDDDDCDDDSKRDGKGGKDDDCDEDGKKKAQIKLIKVVVNDDGGKAKAKDWALKIRPDEGSWTTLVQDTWTTVDAGTYKLSESDTVEGYDWTKLECKDSKSTSIHQPVVTLKKGDKVQCTFTNDDRKQPMKGELKLIKKVVNNDGGTAKPGDWALQVLIDGNWVTHTQGRFQDLPVGTYQIRETGGPEGYDLKSVSCTGGGHNDDKKSSGGDDDRVTIAKGAKVVCTFTNDDRKQPKKGELKLVKKVVNNDGGTADPGDWDLQVKLDGEWVTLAQGTFHELPAGSYEIRETGGPDGYDFKGVSCTGGGHHDDDDDKNGKKSSGSQHPSGDTVTVVKGAKITCTFTNDDRKQPKKGELKLIKNVVNDDGGEAGPEDWDLQVLIDGQWVTQTQGEFFELPAGTYQLRETGGPDGYDFEGVSCTTAGGGGGGGDGKHDDDDDGKHDDDDDKDRRASVSSSLPSQPSGDSVTIAKGAKVECVFTNNDQPSDPGVEKAFDGLVLVGPGAVWEVSYLLTVDNSGQPHPATYTLFDVPNFPSGVTIQGAEVVDVTGGDTPVPWNGQAATPIVTDAIVGAGETHVYRVTFTIALTGPIVVDDRDCVGGPGRGLFNIATLEWPGGSDEAEACEPVPPQPVFDKVALGATAVDADTWALEYRLSVTNPGPGAAEYTLEDTIGQLPSGVTLVEAEAMADPGFPQTPDPLTTSWANDDPVTLALDQPIAQGITHAFLVTVYVDVVIPELPAEPSADCADIPGIGYSIPNLGTFEVDGIVVDDEACNVIQIVDLGIVKTHSTLEGGAVEPGVPFTYFLDVTNHGTVDVVDGVVTDEIPADLTVVSVEVPVGWADMSSGNTVLVEDVALAVGATDRISVQVLLEQPVAQVPPVLGPDDEPGAFVPDFIGELVNTACVAVPGDGNPLNDCDTDTVPVDEIIADIFVSCLNDVAYLNYYVATSPSLAGEPISFSWVPDMQVPSPQPPSVERTLSSGDSGTILWPGGRLAPNDVSIQWPGYRPLTINDYNPATGALLVDPALVYNGMVLDTSYPTYPWRFASTITISVNPTLTIETEYPPATVNCEVPRSADLIIDKTASVRTTAPGASFEYGLSVTNLAVDSVAEPVVVTDIIPADIRVDEIVTSETAFPRWRDCAVTGADARGFGGTLECSLLGPLAMGTTAPLITLGVTVLDTTKASAITNTGEVCWGPATDGQPFQACDDDSVKVTLSGGLPPTGGEAPAGAVAIGMIALLGGLLCLVYVTVRRRREAREDG